MKPENQENIIDCGKLAGRFAHKQVLNVLIRKVTPIFCSRTVKQRHSLICPSPRDHGRRVRVIKVCGIGWPRRNLGQQCKVYPLAWPDLSVKPLMVDFPGRDEACSISNYRRGEGL